MVSAALARLPASWSRSHRTAAFGATVAMSAVLAAALSEAAPTGLDGVDTFWRLVFGAAVAFFAGTARRWTWFVPAGVAALLAADGLAAVCAAGAIIIGFWSVLRDTRSRARGALVAALGVVALLRTDAVGFHGATAVLATAAVAPILVTGYAHAGRRVQRRVRRVGAIALGAGALMIAGVVIGAVSAGDDLLNGMHQIDEGLAAARSADDDLAAQKLGEAARHLSAADDTLTSWFVSPARALPLIGPNLRAVTDLAGEASRVADVTSLAAAEADVDSLHFVDGRLDPDRIAAMQEPLAQVHRVLVGLEGTVDRARSPWLLAAIEERIDRLDVEMAQARPEAETAMNAVAIAPDLLGANGPRRYLVLFTTPVEARGRTGFPGNFAELLVKDGKLSMPRFGRVSELESGGVPPDQRMIQYPTPEFRARYERFDPLGTWRNLTMSPDFLSIALAARELYPQSSGTAIDGVLSVDPVGLAALLRFTGPVDVEGLDTPLTSGNAAQFLQLDQYVQFTDVSQRVDVLEQVARTTFDRLTEADLPGPKAVADTLDPVVDGGHIQFTSFPPAQIAFFEEIGVGGYFQGTKGDDTVAVVTSNAGGNKIDLFLERRLRYVARWDPATGQATATLTATLTNRAPASGLPDYVIGNAIDQPDGTNRSYVSIYSPFDLEAARINGRPAALERDNEVGLRAYSTFVTLPAGGSATIELDLRGAVEGRYDLHLFQQPLVIAEQAEVSVSVAGSVDIGARNATVDGRTATWSGPLDRRRNLSVTATAR